MGPHDPAANRHPVCTVQIHDLVILWPALGPLTVRQTVPVFDGTHYLIRFDGLPAVLLEASVRLFVARAPRPVYVACARCSTLYHVDYLGACAADPDTLLCEGCNS